MTTRAAGGNGADLVDAHAHLTDPAFAADIAAVLTRSREGGVRAVICAGYDAASSAAAVRLAQCRDDVWAVVGIHPNEVAAASSEDFDVVASLARSPEVVGIGEVGLDYYRTRTSPSRQREALDWHLHLAEELELPVVIHNREADADVAEALEASAERRGRAQSPGMLHCFTSTDPVFLDRMLASGYFISFAGVLTFGSAAPLRAVAASVPVDRLLVETDAPYLAPEPARGRRNEPALVRHTAEQLAAIHGMRLDDFTRRLWQNSQHLFPALAAAATEASP